MKHPITLRIDPDLLNASRHHAQRENRTLTNFVETVLRQHIAKEVATADAGPVATGEPTAKPWPGRSGEKRTSNRKTAHG